MLLPSKRLENVPVMSLQTGGEIARSSGIIIDPRTLAIPALYVEGPQVEARPAVLHIEDIREMGSMGFIIDDSSKIMALDGLVRLQEVIDIGFSLLQCAVYDKAGAKLGRVEDFTFDPESYSIQQIYIHQSLLQSITNTTNIISRRQIISVSHDKIVVDSPTIKEKISQQADTATSFVNPFRSTGAHPQSDQIEKP